MKNNNFKRITFAPKKGLKKTRIELIPGTYIYESFSWNLGGNFYHHVNGGILSSWTLWPLFKDQKIKYDWNESAYQCTLPSLIAMGRSITDFSIFFHPLQFISTPLNLLKFWKFQPPLIYCQPTGKRKITLWVFKLILRK